MPCDFLFSVDLEDVRDHVPDGHRYAERVVGNTERYLEFLRARDAEATFFVVGTVAERYPDLIRRIVDEGHELACHTHTHVQLDRHTPESLARDLERNLDALRRCGAEEVAGFRAPTFSVIDSTSWVYEVLESLGLRYSSSVIPGPTPLYGWPGFGSEPRMMGSVLEMPLTLHPLLGLPIGGGVHFRVLPFGVIRDGIRRIARRGGVVQSYFHPYDLDTEQERFMHPDLSGNRLLNALMYIGRSRVLPRLERVADLCRFTSYRSYLQGRIAAGTAATDGARDGHAG